MLISSADCIWLWEDYLFFLIFETALSLGDVSIRFVGITVIALESFESGIAKISCCPEKIS